MRRPPWFSSSDEQYLPTSDSSRVVAQSPAYAYPLWAIHPRIAPAGVAAPTGGLIDGDGCGVAVGTVTLGDVGDLGEGADLTGVDAVDVMMEVLVEPAGTDVDATPPGESCPQPARTSPAEVTADSRTVRLVQALLDDRLPMSTC